MADQPSAQTFAAKIRAANPGAYDDMSDNDLAYKVVTKYPQYQDMVPPNIGLSGPSAPGPIENVAHTEGPIARALTAGENRVADIHQQGQQQEHDFQNRFLNNQPIAAPMLHQNATLQNPINGIVNPEARERFGKGDIAGGIGEVGANVLPLEIARVAGGGGPLADKATVQNFTAPIRGMAKAGNAILGNPFVQKVAPIAGTIAGYGVGEMAGLPWYARAAMGAGGAAIGRSIRGGAAIPGERFGLPPEPPLPTNEGGTVSRGNTLGARPTGPVATPERIYENPRSTRVEINNPPPAPVVRPSGFGISQGSTAEGGIPSGPVTSPEAFIGKPPATTRPESIPAPSKFAGGNLEPATGPERGTPGQPPAPVGKYQPPERNYPARGPIQGPQQETPSPGPMRADVSRLGPPAGVGKYSPPERVPPPVRTAPIQRAAAPVETPAPQVSMADQIATAKGLGFKNLGDAIAKYGYEGWQKVITLPTEPPTASIGPIGKPTPFAVPESQVLHSPWGRPMTDSPEALESVEQRASTHANMSSTPKSTIMNDFNGVATPEVPTSPKVKPYNPDTYDPAKDPTLRDNKARAAKTARQSTKKNNFENTLADAQKKRWTD